jgi:hypothetical protein
MCWTARPRTLIAGGGLRGVADAPALRQPVYAAMHIRHRITPLHRRLTRIVGRQFGVTTAG